MQWCDKSVKISKIGVAERITPIFFNFFCIKFCSFENINFITDINVAIISIIDKIFTKVVPKTASLLVSNTIADLITDGCNMGVKSLNKYLNQYPAADSKVKDICDRLIKIEEKLGKDLRRYL